MPTLIESLETRQHLSATTSSFDDDWKKANDIMSGKAFIAWGDTNKDRRLSYDEQFAKYKATTRDANGDGVIDINDLRTPDRVATGTLVDARKYMDGVDWYEANRVGDAHAWVTSDGTLAISGKGEMRVEPSGSYINYIENGTQLGRFASKTIKRIEVFGSDKAETIRIGDTGKPTVVYARGGNDTVWGGNGADTVYGGVGNDQLHGGGGDDVLFGYDGDDRLWGDSGKDRLEGNGGVDRLDGGSGVNKLNGGGSIDYVIVRAKDKTDRSDLKDKFTILK